MPYTGPEPARRPLSSDDITDGIISTADLADSISINNLSNTAASGIIESNANFVDTCLVGPSVDGKAWAGKFENGSVWSSLMLATVETSGSDAEVNIWDLTDYTLTSATPLATVTLTGATPTSIAAIMGYVIVGTSDQGFHIVDPHDGSWAERTYGWPRSLTASTTPTLTNNNVQFVCAGFAQQPPLDPRTGGPMPSFGVGYGAGADIHSLIKHDGNVWDRSNTVTSGAPCFISNGYFFNVVENSSDRLFRSADPIDGITADDWSYNDALFSTNSIGLDTALDIGRELIVGGDAGGLVVALEPSSAADLSAAANREPKAEVTNAYNTGFMPSGTKLAALANSATADRSDNSNTLTENGTVPSAAVATGAELTAYGPYSTTNFLNRTDSDFNTGTGAFTVLVWAKETSNDGSTRMMATWGAYSGAFTGNGQWSVYVYGGSTAGNRAVGMNCSDDNYSTQDALNTNVDAPQDVYNLYAFVFDFPNAQMRVYLNGQKIGEGSTSNCTTVANASGSIIIGKRHDDASPFDLGLETLFRHSASALSDTQIRKIYEAEKGMFVANAKCLLQGASNAVLDARIDPLTGKYIVTQSDTQDIFDGLAIETERTIAAGGTTFEHGLLWGDGVAEINDANLYASMPATDQRQVNEMVRSLAAELPAGVDLSKAKAWCIWDMSSGSAVIQASYNVESAVRSASGKTNIYFSVPFKDSDATGLTHYVAVASSIASTYNCEPAGLYKDRVLVYVRNDSGSYTDPSWVSVICFGELENE